jgi:hypothetical protein
MRFRSPLLPLPEHRAGEDAEDPVAHQGDTGEGGCIAILRLAGAIGIDGDDDPVGTGTSCPRRQCRRTKGISLNQLVEAAIEEVVTL